jgi:hypothetical protein
MLKCCKNFVSCCDNKTATPHTTTTFRYSLFVYLHCLFCCALNFLFCCGNTAANTCLSWRNRVHVGYMPDKPLVVMLLWARSLGPIPHLFDIIEAELKFHSQYTHDDNSTFWQIYPCLPLKCAFEGQSVGLH